MTGPKLYSTKEAAAALGVSVARVKQVRADRNNEVGTLIGRSLVFTEYDLDQMRQRRPPGRPPNKPPAPDESERG